MALPGFRATEWTTVGLALVATAWAVGIGIARGDTALVRMGILPASILVFFTGVHMWARRSGEMSSTRYLALYSAILGIVIAGSGFLVRAPPLYSWGALVIGLAITAVTTYEAWISYPSREGDRPLDPRTKA